MEVESSHSEETDTDAPAIADHFGFPMPSGEYSESDSE